MDEMTMTRIWQNIEYRRIYKYTNQDKNVQILSDEMTIRLDHYTTFWSEQSLFNEHIWKNKL